MTLNSLITTLLAIIVETMWFRPKYPEAIIATVRQ